MVSGGTLYVMSSGAVIIKDLLCNNTFALIDGYHNMLWDLEWYAGQQWVVCKFIFSWFIVVRCITSVCGWPVYACPTFIITAWCTGTGTGLSYI